MSLSLEAVSLAEVMDECQSMMAGQAHKRGIVMTFPTFEAPCFLYADRTRLKQILINFLSNAVKYNRKEGTVDVSVAPSGLGRIRIRIRDTGVGLSPEMRSQLFQPFNRLGQESHVEEGTGIGLVVAKQLIELMGGEIGVESTEGEGSVFWFDLMAAAEPQLSPGDIAPAPPVDTQFPHGATMRTILYVEDNQANLKLVEQLIARRPDLRLLSASTGMAGITLARAQRPDMILMDINLPDISGIESMKLLRDDPATAHIPVVAISANAMPHDIEKGLRAGFLWYLTKPINVTEFMDTINTALDGPRLRAPTSRAALDVLPLTLRTRLREATLSADYDQILALLDQAEPYDRALADELRDLATHFRYQPLLDLLPRTEDSP